MKKLFLITIAVALLSGCATPPPLEFYPDNVNRSGKRIDADLRSISVRTAPEEQRTGELNWFFVENTIGDQFIQTSTGTGVPVTRQWEAALRDALDHTLLFREGSTRKVSLITEVQKIEMRGIATVDFDVAAKYRLMDRETGEDIYAETIESVGSATTSEDAFIGAVRARFAFVRAVKTNIRKFLMSLQNAVLK
jgi:hypothetical protein